MVSTFAPKIISLSVRLHYAPKMIKVNFARADQFCKFRHRNARVNKLRWRKINILKDNAELINSTYSW